MVCCIYMRVGEYLRCDVAGVWVWGSVVGGGGGGPRHLVMCVGL